MMTARDAEAAAYEVEAAIHEAPVEIDLDIYSVTGRLNNQEIRRLIAERCAKRRLLTLQYAACHRRRPSGSAAKRS